MGKKVRNQYRWMIFLLVLIGLPLQSILAFQGQDEPRFAKIQNVTAADIQQMFYKVEIDEEIDINLENRTVEAALKHVAKKTGLKLTYRGDIMNREKLVTLKRKNITVSNALDFILRDTSLDYLFSQDGYLLIVPPDETRDMEAMQATVTGVVTDAQTGNPLPGANVSIQGTTRGSSTNAQGEYSISEVEPGTYTFVASFIGYEQSTQDVTISEGQNEVTVNFSLQPSDVAMEELVVVGYGQQETSDITGSISSVSGQDIQNVQTDNFAEALQGQSSGVLVTQSSGEPGSGMDVMIRGASTLGSTDPLYVVDGVPIEGDLSQINTNNIESVDILKDASAAAIYGSRAANGVVMITTKRGTSGDIQVDFSARTGISHVPESRRIDMMNSRQFHQFSVDAHQNASLPIPTAWQEPNLSQNLEQNTDWQEALFRSGRTQDYNLSVSGGNEDAVYMFSTNYKDEQGVVVSDGFSRVSFRVNSEFYIGEDDRLTIGENLSLSQSTITGEIGVNTFKEIYQQAPTVPVRCPENVGGFCGPTPETSPGNQRNFVGLLHMEEDEDITRRLIGTVYADYNILSNLSYRFNLSTDMSMGESQSFTPLYNIETIQNTSRDLSLGNLNSTSLILENTLNYNLEFAQTHEIEALVGFTQEERNFESMSGTGEGFPGEYLRTINSATGQKTVNSGKTGSTLRSFLGRVQYGYDDRYRVQFAIRRDGSSRFGSEKRWGTFPSVSASWTISNEAFMSDFSQISRLALRGSWGVTGSQSIPDYAAVATVQPVANYVLGPGQTLASGSAILEPGNSQLQWQETKQLDIGLDVGFFNERLTFKLDYFKKNTSNVLLRVPVPTTSGIWRGNSPFQNIGEVVNSGIDFATSYQQSFDKFSYQVNANISTIKNEVESLGVPSIVVSLTDELGTGSTITRPGDEIGAFYGYISEGPFRDQAEVDNHAEQSGAAPGDLKFRDLNDDGVINANDRTIIGSPFPDFYYGFTANMNYNNWGLRIQLDGVQGRDILALRADNDVRGKNNTTADYVDRWTPDNRDGIHPRAHGTDPNNNLRSSTYRVKDGSYLALRNVTLSYNLNPEVFSQWANFRNLRLHVTSTNLLYFTPYDGYNPEIGASDGSTASLARSVDQSSYPIARTVELGVNIGF